MIFAQYQSHALLNPYVERYVVVKRELCSPESLTISPTCSSQLAINCGTTNTKPDETGALNRHYQAVVVGPFTRRHDYTLHGQIYTIAAYFTPVGMFSLLSAPMHRLADETADMLTLMTDEVPSLLDSVLTPAETDAKVAGLEAFLLSRLPLARPINTDVQKAIAFIRQRGGHLTMPELLQHLKVPQRTIERNFRQTTGLTPKQFARITRFLTVRNAIAEGSYKSWHDVIHWGGYYDQAHFIREFSLFTGQTPSSYFARDLGFDNFLLSP